MSVAVAIDTTPLTPEQRLYLSLLMETAFKLPCAADGAAAALSKDGFVAALQADTVRYACDTGGIKGGSSQLLTFFVQVELDSGKGLTLALKHLRRALYLTQLSPELLAIAAKRRLSEVPAAVRNGNGVLSALSWLTDYTDADNDLNGASRLPLGRPRRRASTCTGWPHSQPATHMHIHMHMQSTRPGRIRTLLAPGHALRQQPFLVDLEAQLATPEGGAAAVATLAALRAALLQPHRMNVFVAGDLTKLPAPHAALAAALRPPSGAAAAAAPATAGAPAAGPISGVAQHRLLSGRASQVGRRDRTPVPPPRRSARRTAAQRVARPRRV